MTRDYRVYLQDILSAIQNVQEYTQGMRYETFIIDKKTVSAVVRELEVIGEAVKQIPSSIRQKYPRIPWSDIAKMRDKLIHFYFGIDKEIVWKTVKERLPELKERIQSMVTALF